MFRNFRDLLHNVNIDDEEAALEEIAQRVVREGMGSAAIAFFESVKPIGFITGQAAIAATPLLGAFIEPMRLERYADLLGNRDFVERLIQRIETLEAEQAGERKAEREKKKAEARKQKSEDRSQKSEG